LLETHYKAFPINNLKFDKILIYSNVGNLKRNQFTKSNSETIKREELISMVRCVGTIIGDFGVDKILNLV
jgi:hypothetical protein